jgi:diguanylate cyclase (GGDEF)-like protein
MGKGARAVAVVAPATALLVLVDAGLAPLATLVLLVTVGALGWGGAPETSPLRRGWWSVALAGIPCTALAVPGLVPGATRPALGVLTALLIVVAAILATPTRDPADAREGLVEATLAGGLAAFGLAVPPSVTVDAALSAVLVVVAAQVAALWLVLRSARATGTRGPGPQQLVGAGLVLLLAVEVGRVLGVAPSVSWVAVATSVALALWSLALAHPEAVAPPVHRARGENRLDASRVALVLAGVLAGPLAVAAVVLVDGAPGPRIALSGALLALVAVLHLLQVVSDRGRRAWRAQHDPLTSLPTEPLFDDRLEQAVTTARRTHRGLAVAFIDLDGFKQVNDRDGHDAGDAVLKIVAGRLRDALREQDTVARKSGDEFLVLLPDVPDEYSAQIVAEKLLGVVQDPIVVDEQRYRVGASIGLALWPRDGTSAEELVRHADAAMYDSKEAGRGRVRWYSTATSVRARLRLTLAQQLEEALGTASLELDQQPRVDLRDGTLVGLVSLVRWRHPDLGRLTPSSFLPIATEAGLSEALDRHVLERACLQAGRWARMGWLDVPVVVHLSDTHTGARDLEQRVVHALADGGLAPARLQLAVTEDGLRLGGETLERTIADLADLGVRTILTRFGSGDVGLGRLAQTRIGGVELASTHVRRLRRPGGAPVVEAAIDLSERLGLDVSGNGVDGEVEVDRLRALGAPVGRGGHLGRPLLKHELDQRLAIVASEEGHDPRRVLAERLIPADHGLPGAENPELAAVVRDLLRPDSSVEESALAEVLRRVSHPIVTRGGPPTH